MSHLCSRERQWRSLSPLQRKYPDWNTSLCASGSLICWCGRLPCHGGALGQVPVDLRRKYRRVFRQGRTRSTSLVPDEPKQKTCAELVAFGEEDEPAPVQRCLP